MVLNIGYDEYNVYVLKNRTFIPFDVIYYLLFYPNVVLYIVVTEIVTVIFSKSPRIPPNLT